MSNSYTQLTNPIRQKRRKIQVACELCRLRKSRCDGGRPHCGACLKRRDAGTECIYYELSSLNSYTKDGDTFASPELRETDSHSLPAAEPNISGKPTATTKGTNEHLSTLMDNGAAHSDWILRAGLLASSNSATFINKVFGRENSQRMNKEASPSPDLANQPSLPHKEADLPGTIDYVLPPRTLSNTAVEGFFKHAFIVWLDRIQFQNWYQDVWEVDYEVQDQIAEQINYAMLYMMIALEYQNRHLNGAENTSQQAQAYIQRSERLLQLQVLDLNRKDLLWALLLLVQWYQSVNKPISCRQTVRLCITIAKNLELDIPERYDKISNEREREMSRRLWHGCVLMDRITSMISNQPLQISQHDAYRISFFRSIDDEYLNTTAQAQPVGQPCKTAFFLAFCQLHRVLGDVLDSQARARGEHSTKVDINMITGIEMALGDFQTNLPPTLQIGATLMTTSTTDHGPQFHLYSRFLYIRILLFRGCFTEMMDNRHSKADIVAPFTNAILRQGQVECVCAAQELLTLLNSRLASSPTSKQDLPQWWHTVTYVYTSSTIVIAALSFPTLVSHFQKHGLEASLSAAFGILDHYSEQITLAGRCRGALEALAARCDTYSRPQTSDEQDLDGMRQEIPLPNDDSNEAPISSAARGIEDLDWLLDESFFSFMEASEGVQ